jgi:uncharacterized Zn finger protein
MGWGWYYERKPKPPADGLRARNKRGDFGETWWGKRWTAVLYDLGMGARLERGRTYARTRRVLSIDLQPGLVKGRVQGSESTPYTVAIRLKAFSDAQRAALGALLAEQPLVAAQLLAGHLPEPLEALCAEADLPLFPARADDLRTACTCPDWGNPCKHAAAVYCLLAEAFDDDPFLVLKVRGVTREELVAMAVGAGAAAPETPPEPEPLPFAPAAFWQAAEPLPAADPVRPPALSAALLRRLGAFPFWQGQSSPLESLEPVYRQATQAVFERWAHTPDAEQDSAR